MSILEVKDLYYTYPDGDQERVILNHASMSFEEGIFYTILGSSGCGKTTFLSLISALDKPKQGDILYKGKNLDEIGWENYRRNNIGIVFQNYHLIPYMNAFENVLVAMGISENKEKDMKVQALKIFESVGIDEKKAIRRIKRLSGGEQQRVAIARALASNADLIVADEPTGNLDKDTGSMIVEIFQKLAHDLNKCVIVVTHAQDVAEKSDVILHLYEHTHNFVL